jgi:hypothetical protein
MMLKSKAQKTSKKEIEKAAGLTRSSVKNIRKKHKNIRADEAKGTSIEAAQKYQAESVMRTSHDRT